MIFGGLHIEMADLRSREALLQNSGWTGALVEAGIASSGTAQPIGVAIKCHQNTPSTPDNNMHSLQAHEGSVRRILRTGRLVKSSALKTGVRSVK